MTWWRLSSHLLLYGILSLSGHYPSVRRSFLSHPAIDLKADNVISIKPSECEVRIIGRTSNCKTFALIKFLFSSKCGGSKMDPATPKYGGSKVDPTTPNYGGCKVDLATPKCGGCKVDPATPKFYESKVDPATPKYGGSKVDPATPKFCGS